MPDPTFAEQMVTALQAKLLKLAGVKSASIDGETLVLSDLKEELTFWERRVARESGSRPVLSSIDLSGE